MCAPGCWVRENTTMHTDAGWDPDLQALLERICEEITRAGESEFRAGTLLLEAKALVKARKQSWLEFVKDAGLEERTTQRLMKVAAYEPYQNPSTLSEMPSDYTTRGVLTGLTEDEFHTRLDAGVMGSGLTFKQATDCWHPKCRSSRRTVLLTTPPPTV